MYGSAWTVMPLQQIATSIILRGGASIVIFESGGSNARRQNQKQRVRAAVEGAGLNDPTAHPLPVLTSDRRSRGSAGCEGPRGREGL